jgi:hypothetical protein
MFVLIETVDIDVIGVKLFHTRELAEATFERLAAASDIQEFDVAELGGEAQGTIRFAGDDAYALQLLEVTPQREGFDPDDEYEPCLDCGGTYADHPPGEGHPFRHR